jgi:AGCS family alanine or glycine:cation symporter
MDTLNTIVEAAGNLVWGPVMLCLLLGTGVYLTLGTRCISLRKLPLAMRMIFSKGDDQQEGHISSFQALMTALSATVGIGNIAGVATAIYSGGPGALFWMWVCALFGMATKYGEAVLAIKYRTSYPDGTLVGGPMWYISKGLNLPWLGWIFAFFGSIAAFGIGNMVQANSVAAVLKETYSVPPFATGLLLATMTGFVLIGGIARIGKVAARMVPFMVILYVGTSAVIIVQNIDKVPGILDLIVSHAFTPIAAAGGFSGALVAQAVRYGVARGIFSNEAGLGSAPIVHAVAKTKSPVRQGLIAMNGTFIDTLIVCSMTGIIILLDPNVWTSGQTSAVLSTLAYETALPGAGGSVVTLGVILFAYSTLIGWSYYGETCVEYIFGIGAKAYYRWIFCGMIIIGASIKVDLVWNICDTMNGAMAIPNLIGLLGLSGVIFRETRKYFHKEAVRE